MENTAQSILRPELLTLTADQLRAVGPELWVFGGAILATILSAMRVLSPKWPVFVVTLLTAVVGIVASQGLVGDESLVLFNGMMVSDAFSNTFNIVFLSTLILSAALSLKYLDKEQLQYPEYFTLLLFSALGMMIMASALDLIVLFIGLEVMSLAVYVLVGFRRADRRSNEAAMKYFILGSAASAVLLYGAALLYGATGSMNLNGILAFVKSHPEGMTPLFAVGAWMVVVGFLFKVATVPFHMWMPDVYEGAPTPVTGFMTTGLKAAAFATFARVLISLGAGNGLSPQIQSRLHDILWVIAVLTMLFGNLAALAQTQLKRMLAYSSIAHSGYLVVGLLTAPFSGAGYAPVVMYLFAYAAMNLGAFGVLAVLSKKDDAGLNLHDLSGLSQRKPLYAAALAVFFFSMAGVPPTAGFAAKYLLFSSAVQAGEVALVVISVLCSAISVYYYLRVLVYLYMREPAEAVGSNDRSTWAAIAVAFLAAITLGIGIAPEGTMNAAKKAVAGFASATTTQVGAN